jgi:acyl carrier protein
VRQRHRERVLEFLRTIQKPDRPLDTVAETDSLVESGLIDSLALLEIVAFLEEQYRIDFAAVGRAGVTSVSGILDRSSARRGGGRDDRRGLADRPLPRGSRHRPLAGVGGPCRTA